MHKPTNHTFNLVGCIIAFILQIALAPQIAIFNVVPSLALCFVVIMAFRSGSHAAVGYAFLLGLFVGIFQAGPVGVLALSYSVAAFLVSKLATVTIGDTLLGRIIISVVAIAAGNLLIGILMSFIGTTGNAFYALGMRVLPGALYGSLICLVFCFMYRPTASASSKKSGLRDRLPRI
jgi:rod shape-determining protein MreD